MHCGIISAARRRSAGGGGSTGYFSAESLASQNIATTTPTDLLTLSIPAADQEANADYLAIWMTESTGSSSGNHLAGLYQDGTKKQESINAQAESVSPPDVIGHSCLYAFNAGATPADITLAVKGSNSLGEGQTISFANSRIVVLKLGADDVVAAAGARQTTTSTTLSAAATLTFTPPSAGDYLILSGFTVDNTGGVETYFQLGDGTTLTNASRGIRCGNSVRRWPQLLMLPLSSISGSKTITLSYRAGGSTAGIADIYIIALRLDRFANSHVARLGVNGGGTETAYTSVISQTFTPAAADHLTLFGGDFGNNSTSSSSYIHCLDGSDTVSDVVREHFSVSNGSREFPLGAARIAAYPATSRTQSVERKSESTNTTTVWADFVIASLDLTGI
jgi:hypothetical protein